MGARVDKILITRRGGGSASSFPVTSASRNNETACANDVKFIIIRVLDNGLVFYAALKSPSV